MECWRVLHSRFEDQLSREILLGQRLRATILAGVFAAIVVALGLLVVVDAALLGRDVLPAVVPVIPVVLMAHQLALRWHIGRALAGLVRVREGFWHLNALVEISEISLGVLAVAALLEYPVHALLTPPVYLYFVFIILSTLRLDFRTSVLTGAVAAVELVVLYLALSRFTAEAPSIEPILDTHLPYLMKAFVLLAAGLAAGFVARELRKRIFGAVVAASERERAEEAGRAKTAFLANMSHEIRTPLNAIVGYAELLEKDGELDGEHRHAVETMKASGDHLLGVINQVLDLSRIEAGREDLRTGDFDVGALVAELTAMFELRCRRAGLTWRADITPTTAWVRGDVGRLRQVLINLLGNAVRMTESGEVGLTVAEESEPVAADSIDSGDSAPVKASAGSRRFTFEVRDTGPGIPRAEQSSIFEPFHTDERRAARGEGGGPSGRTAGGTSGTTGGSGLGLAIASAQVRLMGGRLEVDSAPGSGSRFFFTLPFEAGDPGAAPGVAMGEVVGLGGRDVAAVVADASPVSRELLARMLRRIGVDVLEAGSGEEARGVVAAESPDIVFWDAGLEGPLPESETGRPSLVVVSASALEHERRAFLEGGFDAFIGRPVDTGSLYGCLARVLDLELERAPAPAGEREPRDGTELASFPVPEALWGSLRGAAEEYNVTDLRRHLTRLDELGEGARPLAEHLRRLSRKYDLEAIRAVLDSVPHE